MQSRMRLSGYVMVAVAMTACSSSDKSSTEIARAPKRLTASSGSGQTGDLGVVLAAPLTVRVSDAVDHPVQGIAVSFAVSSGSATLSSPTATSNAQGLASVSLTLTGVGVTTVTATATEATGASAVFVESTGPTVTGQVTLPPGPVRPFAAASMRPAVSRSIMTAALDVPEGAVRGRLTPQQIAKRISTRGRLVVSFKPDAFALPTSAQAYRAEATRQQAVRAYMAALAPHVQAGRIIARAISPAIAAVRVDVAPGQDPDHVTADLRRDPRVLAVEEDRLSYALHVGGTEAKTGLLEFLAATIPALSPALSTQVYPGDPLFYRQLWNYAMIDAPRAWTKTTGSAQVRVAIVDTGIRPDHPAVASLISTGPDNFDFTDGITPIFDSPESICGGTDTFLTIRGTDAELAMPRNAAQDPKQVFLDSDFSTCWSLDPIGSHGTHVAGTVASPADDAVGGTGVNWNVKLMAVRVLGIIGAGFDFDIAQGILYAGGLPATYTGAPLGFTVQTTPADVMNLSIGGPGPSTDLQAAVAAASVNTLIIAAAGNNADDVGSTVPASFPQVMAVGALDAGFGLASYTNVGAAVDISAPGGDFRNGSTGGIASSTFNYVTNKPNYAYYAGTSMATPHVVGVAALVKALNPGLTPAQLRARLEQGAVDLGASGRDDRYGFGVVNAYRSVTATSGPPAVTTARAVDATTGAVVRSATVGSDGRFTMAHLAAGSYFLTAGQDEAADGLYGVPGRRYNWFGTSGMSAISVNATSVTNVALALTAPIEVEPNDDIAHAQPLTVDGWVAGNVGGADVMDLYSVQIPTLATYTFETSGVLGACGTALEADTRLRLLDATGAQIAVNDNTAFSPASLVTYPGLFCSLISSQLQPGRYFLEIRASAGIGGTYRLHIRSGS